MGSTSNTDGLKQGVNDDFENMKETQVTYGWTRTEFTEETRGMHHWNKRWPLWAFLMEEYSVGSIVYFTNFWVICEQCILCNPCVQITIDFQIKKVNIAKIIIYFQTYISEDHFLSFNEFHEYLQFLPIIYLKIETEVYNLHVQTWSSLKVINQFVYITAVSDRG